MDQDEIVASFVAVTGAPEAQALQMLESTGFNLEQAVGLFFAVGEAGGAPAPAAGPSAAAHEDDEALARRLQQEANAAPGDDDVRAPLPSKVERLYGDYVHHTEHRPRNPVPPQVVDAFRDFGAGTSGAGGSGGDAGGARLSSMFEPPRELLFPGNFEEAKGHAASEGRWLILNLQSTVEFASHQLNRDTWRDPGLAALIQSSFVLFQSYNVTDEGTRLATFYHAYEVPAVLVLDPITGAPVAHWTGFMSAERCAERLAPFLDTSFMDPGAARMAASMRRKQSGLGRTGSGVAAAAAPARTADDEEAELQAALAASMAAAAAGGGASAEEAQQMETEEAPPAPTGPSAEEVAAVAAARLPEEPAGPDGCRIGLRFPDGSRGQRRFPRDAPLSAVHDWCLTKSSEAAGGRPFFLSEAMPGAAPLEDLEQTLEAARVADAMLVMKWSD